MKLTKKLIPAIGMLALSACMMVTSTFAWFSMNENVSATGMTVSAKGNQVYLQIINPSATKEVEAEGGGTQQVPVTFENGANQTSAAATTTGLSLLPVNVVNNRNETTKLDENGDPVMNGGSEVKEYLTCVDYAGAGTLVWVTNIGQSNSNGAASTSYSDVSTDANNNNGKYFLKNTFNIRLDPTAGATASAQPLKISSIATSANADAFKNCLNVLVVSTVYNIGADKAIGGTDDTVASTMGAVWECNSNTFTKKLGSNTLSDGVFSAETYAVVDIYVFFNGDDTDCTQAVLAASQNLGYDVTVNFTVA